MPELLAQLLAALPAAPAAPGAARDWPVLASGLRQLRASAEAELAALSAETSAVDAQLRERLAAGAALNAENEPETRVGRVEDGIQRVLPETEAVERHFDHVAALVQPQTKRLARLEARAAFFAAALEVEKRAQRAKQHAIEATPEALASFTEFSAFVHALPPAYSAIRDEATRRLDQLAVDLRRFAVTKLQDALALIDWPSPLPDDSLDGVDKEEGKIQSVASAFAYLVALQLSQQGRSNGSKADGSASNDPINAGSKRFEDDALWAIDCVMDAALVRFRYHFERPDSATNRLAKPEWMFMHILEQTRSHARLADHVLTPELRKHQDALHCCDARILMLRVFISTAQRQLTKNMPLLVTSPALLCHLIDEVLLFEQAVDDEFDYGAFADIAGDRWRYPRCVDALTLDSTALFAWTKADVEYSLQMLSSRASSSATESETSGGSKAWQLPERSGGIVDTADSSTASLALVPPIALDVTLLLDFLCRRFYYMGSDEHRYLYVAQVFYPLLRQFSDSGKARGAAAIEVISKSLRESGSAAQLGAWLELFGVVNALQHVATTLATWEQSSVFLELANKLARSEATRSHVLKLHAAYTQTRERLATAAKAASQAVLSSEEASAVRQALTGPGSMIGPTAAFSAAYAVGSKTMKSIFGGRDEQGDNSRATGLAAGDEAVETPQVVSGAELREPATKSSQAGGLSLTQNGDAFTMEDEDSEAELLFSHSIFERQVPDLKTVVAALLRDATNSMKQALFARDLQLYRSSLKWSATAQLQPESPIADHQLDVSSEIAQSLTVTSAVLSLTRSAVLPECAPLIWKPLASSLDDLVFGAVSDTCPPRVFIGAMPDNENWGRTQLRTDLNAIVRVFCIIAPVRATRSYLRKTSDLLQLLALSSAKLGELRRALDQRDGGDDSDVSDGSDAASYDEEADEPLPTAPSNIAGAGRLLNNVRFSSTHLDEAATDAMEQLTTMLEACGIFTLAPSQVLRLLKDREQ